MNEIQLKNYVEDYLNNIASLNGVKNLDRYFSNTDLSLPEINQLKNNSIQQVFAQFILHTQNGTMISSIVNFRKNYGFLKTFTCNFDPQAFLICFGYSNENDRNKSVNKIVGELRYDELTNPNGLKWKTDKSKNKDTIIKRFANSLIDGAVYLKKFKSKNDVINDFNNHYQSIDELIKYTESNFKNGFSVALCCDFLKELSPVFDIPKPDVHIMDVVAEFKGRNTSYYKKSKSKAIECIKDFISIVDQIKKQDPSMTVYKFDRQIWLCCTGNFFLDSKFNIKETFLRKII